MTNHDKDCGRGKIVFVVNRRSPASRQAMVRADCSAQSAKFSCGCPIHFEDLISRGIHKVPLAQQTFSRIFDFEKVEKIGF